MEPLPMPTDDLRRLNRSFVEGMRLRAVECYQLAENAKHQETRNIYIRLGLVYERMAEQAEQNGPLVSS
jgi:hypothetical protein